MSNKLLEKFIKKVETRLFGLPKAITNLMNMYMYYLLDYDWLKRHTQLSYDQVMLHTPNKDILVGLDEEGMYISLDNNVTQIAVPCENKFPDIDEVVDFLQSKELI